MRTEQSSKEVPLTQWNWFTRAKTPSESIVIGMLVLAIPAWNLVGVFVDGVQLGVRIAVLAALTVVLFGMMGTLMAVRHPTPYADLSARTVRVRSRTTPFAAFTSAQRRPTGGRSKRVAIELHAPGQTILLELRDSLGRLTTGRTQEAVLELLRGSSIEPPTSRDDPTGRFAAVNFPAHLTRDQAIALAEHPLTAPDVGAGTH
ncbi:hypothetical protein HRK28_12265 [Rathayibacter sp. VKM Ac-2835]|uniref:hypothetical protein n=1 Tax=Rathayibacter sp. VKM Ac-2835 TaxID=2739043 RepID=UPI001565701F|nr:hypothetical protein [Rathayibacter sp. VKM Ac-2835]NRG41688.1 hypothetical protein [Rathayibacter sp. VKM Ac-2835]